MVTVYCMYSDKQDGMADASIESPGKRRRCEQHGDQDQTHTHTYQKETEIDKTIVQTNKTSTTNGLLDELGKARKSNKKH